MATGDEIVAKARKYLGVPYLWGGSTAAGFDCSGLTQRVYKDAGISIPRTSQEQYKVGTPVAMKDIRPGDLLFFGPVGAPSHVGIAAQRHADGPAAGPPVFMIDSPHTGSTVSWRNAETHPNYLGARRIAGAGTDSVASNDASADSTTSVSTGGLGWAKTALENGIEQLTDESFWMRTGFVVFGFLLVLVVLDRMVNASGREGTS